MIHYKIFLVTIRLISASSIVNPSVDNAKALEQITSEIYFQRNADDLIVSRKEGDNKFVTVNEDGYENLGITKKAEGVFIIESIGLLFFNKNASKVKLLNLSYSNIQRIDESIEYLSNITELNLSGNQFTNLPNNFSIGLKNLTKLDLCNSKLTNLPNNFGNDLAKLKQLCLSYNVLTNLPDDFGKDFISLEELKLDNGKLQSLPDKFGIGLTNLERLDLRNNSLSQDQIDKLKNRLSNTKVFY